MVQFTLIELHLDDVEMPSLPFGAAESDEAIVHGSGTSEPAEEDDSSMLPSLIAALVVVGLAVAVRRFFGGGDHDEQVDSETVDPLAAD